MSARSQATCDWASLVIAHRSAPILPSPEPTPKSPAAVRGLPRIHAAPCSRAIFSPCGPGIDALRIIVSPLIALTFLPPDGLLRFFQKSSADGLWSGLITFGLRARRRSGLIQRSFRRQRSLERWGRLWRAFRRCYGTAKGDPRCIRPIV
jgi:hypothetical protein